MTEALERVIAEQQRRIDQLDASLGRANQSLGDAFRRQEEIADAAFLLLFEPSSESYQRNMREKLRAAGFCLHCERFVCECGDDE